MSADGTAVVGGSNGTGGNQAFLWTAATGMVGLGFLPGATDSGASRVNSDGTVVVGGSGGKAFRWTADVGMQSIQDLLSAAGVTNVTGWQLTVATGVSADGSVISGQGIDPSGRNQGWIAKLPLSAAAQITNLISLKESFNLPQGIENSLDAKLSNAQSSLAANNITAACNQMGAFIQETSAQSGKMLTVDQANQLNLAANQIRATLKCGSM